MLNANKGRSDVSPTGSCSQEGLHPEKVREELMAGRLGALGVYLREGGVLTPELRQFLVALIEGGPQQTGWRLRLGRHPDLARSDLGREKRYGHWREDFRVACFVVESGGLERGRVEAAISLTAEMMGFSVSKVTKIWRRLGAAARLRTEGLYTLRTKHALRTKKDI